MALTELQVPNKLEFYRHIQNVAGEVKSRILRWQEVADFMATLTPGDFTAMGIADAQVVSDLEDFRVVLTELVAVFNNTAVTPVKSPLSVCNKLRVMMIL